MYKRLLEFFVAMLGLVSMYGTQQGISSFNSNPIISWGGAISLNGALTVLWLRLLEKFPRVNQRERRQYLALMAGICVITFFASTQFTVITWGGRDAVRTHHEQTLQAADAQALKLYRRQAAIANSAEQFDGYAKQFDRIATEEAAKGTMSGMTGAGSVVNTLRNVAGLLENMSSTSAKTDKVYAKMYAEFKEASARARKVVADIEKIQLDDLDRLRALNLQFGMELALINEVTARMAETSSATYLKATIDSIGELTKISHSSDKPEQKAALEAIAPVVESTQKALLRITTQAPGSTEEIEVHTFSSISPIAAIYKYWSFLLWAWAFGVALDFFPVCFLALETIGHRSEREEEENREDRNRPRRMGSL